MELVPGRARLRDRGPCDHPSIARRAGVEVDDCEEIRGLPGLVTGADVEVTWVVAGFSAILPGLAEGPVRTPDGDDPAEDDQTDGHRSQPND